MYTYTYTSTCHPRSTYLLIITNWAGFQRRPPEPSSEPIERHLCLNMVWMKTFTNIFTKSVLFFTETYFAGAQRPPRAKRHRRAVIHMRNLLGLLRLGWLKNT